jgi:ABC-type dipeptide/oligopeptide/nickel transport system permease subunit
MERDGKRAVIAIARRVVFSGLILLLAWSILFSLRGAIPESSTPAITDWSISSAYKQPVEQIIGPRLGTTIKLSVFGGLLGIVIAALLLFLGTLLSQITERPSWLARLRTILRLMVVNSGVSMPIFITALLLIAYRLVVMSGAPKTVDLSACILVSLLPAWLLVQYGQGEIKNWSANLPLSYGKLIPHLLVKSVVMTLKLVGTILVSSIFVEIVYNLPGVGRLFVSAAFAKDFPFMFGIAWTFILIVVPAKLLADLIDITYNHFSLQAVEEESKEESASAPRKLNGWLVFCFALVLVSIIFALAGPAIAPFDSKTIDLRNSLQPPSDGYILGTDELGRDTFSRILSAPRYNLLLPMASTAILLIAAFAWALLAAFVRKSGTWWADTLEDVIALPRDVWCSFPWLVTGIIFFSLTGSGLFKVVLIGSLIIFPRAFGVMREAYQHGHAGKSWLYGVLAATPVMALFAVAGGMLFLSGLGFLGFGMAPPSAELGGMVSGAYKYILTAPWLLIWPGAALSVLLLVWVMAGDTLAERLGFRSKAIWSKMLE